MNTEQLLDKWQNLEPEEQTKVLDFINSISQQKTTSKSTSNLGKKLRTIRQEIINSGVDLLTAEQVEQEKAERRGGFTKIIND